MSLLAGLVIMAGAGYGAGVLGSATWAATQQLDALFPFYKWRTRPFPAEELAQFWHGLAGVAAVAGVGVAGLLIPRAGRSELVAWGEETGGAIGKLRAHWRGISRPNRTLALTSFALITGLRCYLSQPSVTPEYDDVASYELFASKSLLAVASYYPVPNNHVLANTLSWLFYQANPGFWFTMRLPVLLAATAATGLLFMGLLWANAGFRAAWLATAIFSLTNLSLYHAAVGRGYWLLTALAGVVFFCTLALDAAPRYVRAAWSGIILGSVWGLYTVPTFALVYVSAVAWLALGAIRRRDWYYLGVLLAMSMVVAMGSLLLYAPLLFVSGPRSFFANGFISAQTLPEFWAGLPAYLWHTEGALVGQMKVGGLLVLAGLGASVFIWRRAAAMGPAAAPAWQQLAPAAGWYIVVPYAVLAGRHVFAPERTLLYKGFFFFVLLALVIDWLLHTAFLRKRRWLRVTLTICALLWTGYQLHSLWRDSRPLLRRNQAFHAAFLWLASQPRGPLLVPESTHSLFMRMYLHAERPGEQWEIDAFPLPRTNYRYVLAFPNQRGAFQPEYPFLPSYHNAEVDIYRVPAGFSFHSEDWKH